MNESESICIPLLDGCEHRMVRGLYIPSAVIIWLIISGHILFSLISILVSPTSPQNILLLKLTRITLLALLVRCIILVKQFGITVEKA